jgi:peptidoglycan/xylan/chitin deacetylase (PgdA/CDA1 family)
MSVEQIACLRRHGMHIGSHGYKHVWLNSISAEAQAEEIARSLAFLGLFGVAPDNWTIGYPYGGLNDSLLQTVRSRGCSLGFSVEPRVADLSMDNPLKLPRVDTNDLPS